MKYCLFRLLGLGGSRGSDWLQCGCWRFWLPLFFVIAIGCGTPKAASAPVAPATPTVIHNLPQNDQEILDESEKVAARIQDPNPIDRADYLTELCKVSVQIKSAKAAAKCRAAFDFATANVPGCEGEKLQAQAVATLSAVDAPFAMDLLGEVPNLCGERRNGVTCLSVDAAAAMERLTEINFERPRPGKWAYEDPRYNAAETTFNNFLTSLGKVPPPRGVANIIAKARYLGQTGQYPYLGVAEVVSRLPASFKNEKNILLSDATGFYASETGFYNRDEEVLRLLQSLRSPPLDKALVAHALATFVQRLKNDPIHFPGDFYAEVEIKSNGKVFPFTDRNDAFLFQAFPLIRHFNPGLAAQLRQQDPKLDQATDNMTYISGGFAQGNPTSEQAAQQHFQWLQESLVERIKKCQHSNPQAAARLAQRLTDLPSRIVGFSASIPGTARTNPAEARSLYEKQLLNLRNLGARVDKLRAMVALVPAAYHVGDSKQYEYLSSQALDMGVQFFNSDVQANRAGRREGFSELRDLVISTASLPSDILKTKVEDLRDGWLKDYLSLYEAVGHAQLKFPLAASESCSD